MKLLVAGAPGDVFARPTIGSSYYARYFWVVPRERESLLCNQCGSHPNVAKGATLGWGTSRVRYSTGRARTRLNLANCNCALRPTPHGWRRGCQCRWKTSCRMERGIRWAGCNRIRARGRRVSIRVTKSPHRWWKLGRRYSKEDGPAGPLFSCPSMRCGHHP
jgi:hypothetical protein